jgi:hypothetical protein
VLSERASRAPLGGLPPAEYLLHVLVVFGFGAGAATFWWATADGPTAPLTGVDHLRVLGSIAFTAILLAVETTLFARSLWLRRGAPASARGARPTLGCPPACCS